MAAFGEGWIGSCRTSPVDVGALRLKKTLVRCTGAWDHTRLLYLWRCTSCSCFFLATPCEGPPWMQDVGSEEDQRTKHSDAPMVAANSSTYWSVTRSGNCKAAESEESTDNRRETAGYFPEEHCGSHNRDGHDRRGSRASQAEGWDLQRDSQTVPDGIQVFARWR